MRRSLVAWLLVALVMAIVPPAIAQGLKPATRVSHDLATLHAEHGVARALRTPAPPNPALRVTGDWVTIDASATGDPAALAAELRAAGAINMAVAGRLVSAELPLAAIPKLESMTSLQFARPAYMVTHAGAVTSQGDKAMRADTARASFGVEGTGVMVGVLSDSFGCIAGGPEDDAATLDLPASVLVIEELPFCGLGNDEGRAMLQIVHDVAPGAALAFATAVGGEAHLAGNIRALFAAGADVIVDDILYLAEPMFQDGVVAQAVDEVVKQGVSYFSSAGNAGRHGYDHAFVPGTVFTSGAFTAASGTAFLGGTAHDFGGGNVFQRVTVAPRSAFALVLQWDEPFFSVSGPPGAQSDLDVYVLDSTRTLVLGGAATDNRASKDPVEFTGYACESFTTPCVVHLMIVKHGGPDPGRMKYVVHGGVDPPTFSPAIDGSTIYGHANAAGAVAVGAADYRKTPAFGVSIPVLEPYSAAGPTPVLFDRDGTRLATPDARALKPEIVAPDATNTTFFGGEDLDADGRPNFRGTSAAAPHAAAVAALMLQALPSLTPARIREVLQTTSLDMGPVGFDNHSGFGLVQASAALAGLHSIAVTRGPAGTPNPVASGAKVSLDVAATDSLGHTLTFAWSATCPGAGSGTFDDAALAQPTWTAPVNNGTVPLGCTLRVTVSDGHGTSEVRTSTQHVNATPRITSFAPVSGPVGTVVTIIGINLSGATAVTFAGPVTVTPTAMPTTLLAMVPAGAMTGALRVMTPEGTPVSAATFKVLPRILGFSPAGAAPGSSTVVTVVGTNLRVGSSAPAVKIGALTLPASALQSSTPTEVRLTVPVGAVTGKIGVTTQDGTATSAVDLVVIKPPKPATFAPAAAPVGGQVIISGLSLAGATAVTFTGPATVTPTALTATSLKVVVPPGARTGVVSVTNPAGTGFTTTVFKVQPRIASVTPPSVVAASQTVVTVSGLNLMAATGTPIVRVGGVVVLSGSVLATTPTEIQLRVPPSATTGKLSVTTLDGVATSPADLVVIRPPRPTTVAPVAAPVGSVVAISGLNMAGATAVTLTGPVTVTPTAVTATSLKVVVPIGARTGVVSVTNPAGTASTVGAFKVQPRIDGFSPPSVVAGSPTAVTVSGLNLVAATGTPVVKVGAVVIAGTSVMLTAATEIQLRVPAGVAPGKISVTTIDGVATSAGTLVVIRPPKPTTFAPAAAPVGGLITINGANLLGVTDVTFSGPMSVSPTAVTATSLKAVVPVGARTGPISVTNAAGTAASAASFKVQPRIDGFSPPTVVAGSDTIVSVSGTNLMAATGQPIVRIGAITIPGPLTPTATATLIQLRVPLAAVTGKISVTTVDGTVTSAGPLAVLQPPRPTTLVPAAAPVGALVTINGLNLAGTTGVTFTGPVTVTPTAVTATAVKAIVPVGARTGPIQVTNPIATGTTPAAFKVQPRITGFSPSSAAAGSATVVSVSGTNLVAAGGPLVVKLGASVVAPAGVTATATLIQFPLPSSAVTGSIVITTVDGTATSATPFRVIKAPRVTSFAPASGIVGALVTITGANLVGVTEVTFTGAASVTPTALTATSLKALVPAGALSGPISVTNAAGTASSAASFKLLPRILGFSPGQAARGNAVVVTGTNLKIGGTDPVVKVGTFAATIVASSPTEVTFTIPPSAVTARISVATADGVATSATTLAVTP